MSTPALLVLGLLSALRVPGPLSARPASYRIEARLDGAQREVHGAETLSWRNDATGAADRLVFHLYMNAFKNDGSTFFRERHDRHHPVVEDHRWGYIRVERAQIRRAGGAWQPAALAPLGDETLATLALDRPIAPGETVEVSLTFTTRLPAVVARTGVAGAFYAVAQWFPKVAVFECTPACAFRADELHANGEFYADFGVYDVALDLPSGLVVGATGVLVEEQVVGDRLKQRWHAEDVHDFVFTADPRFRVHEVEVADDATLPPVHVRLLGGPREAPHAERHLAAARAGLLELGRRLGAYPYSQLTIVQPPADAVEAGGMEYPTLFFTEDDPLPAWMPMPELTTAHELAHQWLQGMLASDEVNEAWLDEGLTELATGWVLDRLRPGPWVNGLGHALSYHGFEQVLLDHQHADPPAQPSYAFRDGPSYAENTYRKTSLVLATVAARMGEPAFERAMRGYADRHRFHHPRGADLIAAFAEAPEPVRVFLREGLYRAAALDYAIVEARSTAARPTEGLLEADGGVREVRDPAPAGGYHHAITVEQRGELALPVTLRARFADGSQVDRPIVVEPPRRWARVELDGPSALVEASLYPAADTPIDAQRWNDGLRRQPDAGPRRTLVTSLQHVLAIAIAWLGR